MSLDCYLRLADTVSLDEFEKQLPSWSSYFVDDDGQIVMFWSVKRKGEEEIAQDVEDVKSMLLPGWYASHSIG